ncbi:hypothetical protein J2Q11_06545 [Tenacibaculum finnmarkense genomovar finnmarkense]|uniref:hypothetical protein n=1 Tax=Tenacibaculum finnmarkense TaxID=2781243 RepID=UPI001E3BC349|nr:hypothetical protein [Tenacibaculum finnmarkense]MCD8417382.1 hypothetical protein [Tenacibaculum finnmarkense genomovar finnmarkense]MCG8185723.1 hypothetical protein [Tenacibaculum finnmarkense genomovar finnmarkense]MCG8202276.1 hypothetical protein [Tenacibaculum finnmarkense genomovar finnmarkense]MCG8209720.1 hypothetical protein [Tenacibaculum finnmarkense genomovar finnmarkense]MCG8212476.1 hypothetical protein [Tenacibaculum finnmarkense genomovar finnmarkense]
MSTPLEAIYLLEDKLKNLLHKYEFLKEENQVLRKDNAKLQGLLEEKTHDLTIKQEEYQLLKVAKTMRGSNEENRKETKQKINTLVREIDKCISLLNS